MVVAIDPDGDGELIRAHDVVAQGQVQLCEVFEGKVEVVLVGLLFDALLYVHVVGYVLGELNLDAPALLYLNILFVVQPLNSIHVMNLKGLI